MNRDRKDPVTMAFGVLLVALLPTCFLLASRYQSLDERELQPKPFVPLINRGDGVLDKVAWYERGYVQQDVVFADLNEDGLLDAVFVDRDFRQPALVVSMGRKNGVPLREGHYPLQGLGGTVISGDVDGDGDIDLAVLEQAVRGGGSGIYILSNQTKTDD